MQKLGKGIRELDMIFSFLGIDSRSGSHDKWDRLMNRLGIAEWEVAKECMDENLEEETLATHSMAYANLMKWLGTAEGKAANAEQIEAG